MSPKRLLSLTILCAAAALAQPVQRQNTTLITPAQDGTIGELRLLESDGYTGGTAAHYAGFKATAAMSANAVFTLPAALPASVTQCLEVTTAGVIQYAAGACGGAGGTPAGADTEVQLNNAGAFGASPEFKFRLIGAIPELSIGTTNTGTAAVIEFGSSSAVNSSVFDWHTSGNAIDYDCRWLGYGGTGSAGNGTVRFECAKLELGTNVDVIFQTGGATNFGTDAARAGTGYFDTLNTEFVALRNAGHSAEHLIDLDGSNNAVWANTSGGQILGLSNSGALTLYGSLLVSADSTHDIGATATRVRNGFADLWNAAELEITNAAHSTNWKIKQDAASSAELDILDPSNNPLITFETSNIFFYKTPQPASGFTVDIGTSSAFGRFREYWASEDFNVGGAHASTPVAKIGINAGTSGGYLELTENPGAGTPDVIANLQLNSFALNNASGSPRALFTILSDDAALNLYSSSSVAVANIQTDGVGLANSGVLLLGNSSSATKVLVGLDSDGDGYITLRDSTDGGNATISADGTTPNLLIELLSGGDVLPDTANDHDFGGAGAEWLNIYGNFFKVRSSAGTCTIVSGSGALAGACSNTCDMALRTDGGAGSTLYVCEGGTWAAK